MEKYQDLISGERGYFVVNKENIEKAKDLLSDNGIQYTSDYVTGYDVFAEEEALYRMGLFEEENNIKFHKEDLDEIYSNLVDTYRVSENYVDSDGLQDHAFQTIYPIVAEQAGMVFNTITEQIKNDANYDSANVDITRDDNMLSLMYHSDTDSHSVGNSISLNNDKFNDEEFREICDKNNYAYIINE